MLVVIGGAADRDGRRDGNGNEERRTTGGDSQVREIIYLLRLRHASIPQRIKQHGAGETPFRRVCIGSQRVLHLYADTSMSWGQDI